MFASEFDGPTPSNSTSCKLLAYGKIVSLFITIRLAKPCQLTICSQDRLLHVETTLGVEEDAKQANGEASAEEPNDKGASNENGDRNVCAHRAVMPIGRKGGS